MTHHRICPSFAWTSLPFKNPIGAINSNKKLQKTIALHNNFTHQQQLLKKVGETFWIQPFPCCLVARRKENVPVPWPKVCSHDRRTFGWFRRVSNGEGGRSPTFGVWVGFNDEVSDCWEARSAKLFFQKGWLVALLLKEHIGMETLKFPHVQMRFFIKRLSITLLGYNRVSLRVAWSHSMQL